MSNKHYSVAIIGGGISGCALFYELARYTDIKSIVLLEKYGDLATLSSNGKGNSQTIHCGDIETNYTFDKAKQVKRTANMIIKYCLQHDYQNKFMFAHQKMAVGIGDEEVEYITARYHKFKELYPYLEIFNKKKLKEIEPKIVVDKNQNDRTENIIGVGVQNHYSTVNYQAMANSLVENAKKTSNKQCDIMLNSEVVNIKNENGIFTLNLKNNSSIVSADCIVVNAGGHSLYLAHKMSYGEDFGCLPIAGSYYITNKPILNGKVYMIQNPKLPFAALHGDPDILENEVTRFGPTALFMPKLERYHGLSTVPDFFKTLNFDTRVLKVIKDLLSDKTIRNYVLQNFIYEIPYFNKRAFLKNIQKLVPSLCLSDIKYAKNFGGVRPQVLNKKEKELILGEVSINTKNGIIFNMTPSPGATSCLGNAEKDTKSVCDYLGATFYEDKFLHDLTDIV